MRRLRTRQGGVSIVGLLVIVGLFIGLWLFFASQRQDENDLRNSYQRFVYEPFPDTVIFSGYMKRFNWLPGEYGLYLTDRGLIGFTEFWELE